MHFSQIISEHGFSPLWKYILPWLCLYASSVCRRLQEREFCNLILCTLFSFREDLEEFFLHFISCLHYTHLFKWDSNKDKGRIRNVSYFKKNTNFTGSEIPPLC